MEENKETKITPSEPNGERAGQPLLYEVGQRVFSHKYNEEGTIMEKVGNHYTHPISLLFDCDKGKHLDEVLVPHSLNEVRKLR